MPRAFGAAGQWIANESEMRTTGPPHGFDGRRCRRTFFVARSAAETVITESWPSESKLY